MSAAAASSQDPERRRGRPKGKNRVPLTHEQRRARNAGYERQRRVEHNAAMAALAEAVGLDAQTCSATLLRKTISLLNLSKKKESIEDLKIYNNMIKAEIAALEKEVAAVDKHHAVGNS